MKSIVKGLKYCVTAYRLFERVLQDEQYVDGMKDPSHRLFCQYHSPQTDKMKKDIMAEIMKALRMGVDVPYVTQIIHTVCLNNQVLYRNLNLILKFWPKAALEGGTN